MDDKTHKITTFAVVFRGFAKDPKDKTQARVARRHYIDACVAMQDVIAFCVPEITVRARSEEDGEIVIIAIPPGQPHDYDGPAVMRLLYGASA